MEPASSLQSLFEAVQSLRSELERARMEAARDAEVSQAKDAELARLRDALASSEHARRQVENAAREREAELGRELDEGVRRERMLRDKFEEELRKLGRLRAAAEAEQREQVSIRDKELGSLISSQNDIASQYRQERRRLEELVASYEGELGRLRAVLQALDDKLAREKGSDQATDRERRALEVLMTSLLHQNTRLQGALEALARGGKGATKEDLLADTSGMLERFGGEVRGLEMRLADQLTAVQKLMAESDVLRDKLWAEAEAKRTSEEARLKLDAELQLLRPQLPRLEADLSVTRAAAATVEVERNKLAAKLEAAERRLEALEHDSEELRTTAETQLARQKKEADALVKDLRERLDQAGRRPAAPPAAPKGFLGRLLGG